MANAGVAHTTLLDFENINTISAAGVALAHSRDDTSIMAVDQQGPEFLIAVEDRPTVSVTASGTGTIG
ncbi:hypothetical protein [Kocuria sp. CH-021]|uniref:hypothetical protein n=1 Tax=Kocuria sp. CH-021 TaxID=3406735 RepID=UPI003C72DBD1